MKPRVYLETTIPSYLTAWPSRDIVRAAEQAMTRTWWQARDAYELYVSELVVGEVSAGDSEASAQRLEAIRGIPVLLATKAAEHIGANLILRAALPKQAAIDAVHIAIAAVHEMDYLLTWNCKHIANATMRGRIGEICRAAGVKPPVICTPMELIKE